MELQNWKHNLRLGSALEGAGKWQLALSSRCSLSEGRPEQPHRLHIFLSTSKRVESGRALNCPGFIAIPFNRCQLHEFLMKPSYEANTLYVIVHRGQFQVKKKQNKTKQNKTKQNRCAFLNMRKLSDWNTWADNVSCFFI